MDVEESQTVVPGSSGLEGAPAGEVEPQDKDTQKAVSKTGILPITPHVSSQTAHSRNIPRALAAPFIMTGAILGKCVKGVRNALSGIARGLKGIRSQWGERGIAHLFAGRAKHKTDQEDVQLEVREDFSLRPYTDHLSEDEQDALNTAEGNIRRFNNLVGDLQQSSPISPERLATLPRPRALIPEVALIGSVDPKLLASLKKSADFLAESPALSPEQQTMWYSFSEIAQVLINTNKAAILKQHLQRATLPAKYAIQAQVAARAVGQMQTNPRWFLELDMLPEMSREMGSEIDIADTQQPCLQCLDSMFDGTTFITELHRPQLLSPNEMQGQPPQGLEDLFSKAKDWAQSCSSHEIVTTFGRMNPSLFTINGQGINQEPFEVLGDNTDPDSLTMKTYLIFEQLVQEYIKQNPNATQKEASEIVNEAMTRQAIDFSTIGTFVRLEYMSGSSNAIKDNLEKSEFSFSVSHEKISVEKKGEIGEFHPPEEEGEEQNLKRSISYSAQITVTPADMGKTEWTETFKTGTGKAVAKPPQEAAAAAQPDRPTKSPKDIDGDISVFSRLALNYSGPEVDSSQRNRNNHEIERKIGSFGRIFR